MGEGKVQRFQDSWSNNICCGDDVKAKDQWKVMVNDHKGCDNFVSLIPMSPPASSSDSTTMSNGSSSSSSLDTIDDDDDAASSFPHQQYSSFSNSAESLYDFSELMDQLPIKRGLSKFYQGKSESFTSLSMVTSLDDLKKKERPPYRRKTKCYHRGGLDKYKSFTLPKPTISKKTPRASLSSPFPSKRVSFFSSNTPSQILSQKD